MEEGSKNGGMRGRSWRTLQFDLNTTQNHEQMICVSARQEDPPLKQTFVSR